MKKIIVFFGMFFSLYLCHGQDVRVNINNQEYNNKDNTFYINGIPSTQDIGGVDAQFYVEVIDYSCNYEDANCSNYVKFTNYNSFPVTVLCITSRKFIKLERTHNLVLGANGGEKKIPLENDCHNREDAKKGYISSNYEIRGMIVRKIGQ